MAGGFPVAECACLYWPVSPSLMSGRWTSPSNGWCCLTFPRPVIVVRNMWTCDFQECHYFVYEYHIGIMVTGYRSVHVTDGCFCRNKVLSSIQLLIGFMCICELSTGITLPCMRVVAYVHPPVHAKRPGMCVRAHKQTHTHTHT